MTQSIDTFFSGGGGRSVSWKDKPVGSTVSGVVEAVHPPQQVTDPVDGKPKFKRDGTTPIMQVRIDLQTEYRNWEMCRPPEDPAETDDGRRSLYCGGWMVGAIGDALRKAGQKGSPQEGGKLSVTLTERPPPDNPALNPTNKFSAEYTPPSAAATGQFFETPAASNGLSSPAAPAPQRPASITEAAWAAMPPETQKQVAATFATMAGSQSDIPF